VAVRERVVAQHRDQSVRLRDDEVGRLDKLERERGIE
jgi:hypothetical protein